MAHTHRMGNYNSNYQTKIDMNCCDHYAHKINGNWVCGIEPGVCQPNSNARSSRKYNPGGMLHGLPHEQSGIPANVGGNEQIELEGGEYIINAQTTKALGEGFLNKLAALLALNLNAHKETKNINKK